MDFSPHATLLFCTSFFVCHVDSRVLVRTQPFVEATIGQDPLTLECSYRTTSSEFVMSVNWNRKAAYDKNFKQIAQLPNRRWLNLLPTFSDKNLASRGNITSCSEGDFELVRLEISPTECHDEGTYECEVLVYGHQLPTKAKVQVHLNEKPSVISLKYHPASPIENHPMTFTCTASMGRPVGTFKWLVYKSDRGSNGEGVELSGSTKLSNIPGSCSLIGTSTLAIIVTRSDRRVECVVHQHAEKGAVQVSEERALDVKYKVTDTKVYIRVAKADLPVSRETVVCEGDDIYFLCVARGNPNPTFKWSYLPLGGHKGPNALIKLIAQPGMSLWNVTVNQSGSYVCVATNHLGNIDYTETKSIRIIVKEKATFKSHGQSSDSNSVERYLLIGGIVIGTILFTLSVSLLSFLIYRRCSQKSNVIQNRYTGVNT